MSTDRKEILEKARNHGGCSICHGSINSEQARILCTKIVEMYNADTSLYLMQNHVAIIVACGDACAATVAGAMDYTAIERILSEKYDMPFSISARSDVPVNVFIRTVLLTEVYNRIDTLIEGLSQFASNGITSIARTFMGLREELHKFYEKEQPPEKALGFDIIPGQSDENYISTIENFVRTFAIHMAATNRTISTFERAIVEAFERPTCLRGAMIAHPVPYDHWLTKPDDGAYGIISFPVVYRRNGDIIRATFFSYVHYTLAPQ